MTFDIIIPTYNEESNLKKLLPYINSISKNNEIQIYVVDCSNSTDKTKEVCMANNATYIKCPYKCRSIQLNEGAQYASGDILFFLRADTQPPMDVFSKIEEAVAKGFKAGFFSFKFKSGKWLLKLNSFFTKFDGIFAGGGDQGHFFTRETFEQLSGYNKNQVIMEDFEMFDRIKINKIPYKIIDSPVLVSDRKYQNNSYLRVSIVNLLAFIKYKRRLKPIAIKEFYTKWLN